MVPGPPPGLNALSGTAPASQIKVPFGWTTRKHATDMYVVATSSFFKRYGDVSGIFKLPPSNTYSRTDFGGCALGCCCWEIAPEGRISTASSGASDLRSTLLSDILSPALQLLVSVDEGPVS